MYLKNCPSCGIEIFFITKNLYKQSIKRNSGCLSCKGKKISDKTKGVEKSSEHKKKLSEVKIGCKLSIEHKKKIAVSCKGKKRTNQTKKKISESKLGDRNPSKRQDVKDRIRNTVNNLFKEDVEYRNRISKSLIKYFSENKSPVEEISAFKEYRRIVDNITSRNKKRLYEDWDGYDYYDDEFIRENLSLHFNNKGYPSIDHKISVYSGFKDGILPYIVGGIDNLCITKRVNNSKKGSLNEDQFKI